MHAKIQVHVLYMFDSLFFQVIKVDLEMTSSSLSHTGTGIRHAGCHLHCSDTIEILALIILMQALLFNNTDQLADLWLTTTCRSKDVGPFIWLCLSS